MLPNDDQHQLAHAGPTLPINGGGTPTREDAERDCLLFAIALAPGGAYRDNDTNAAEADIHLRSGDV